MCLSTVYINSGGQKKEVMRDVAQIEAKKNGYVLIGLFGEKEFIKGKVKSVDFLDGHSVILE